MKKIKRIEICDTLEKRFLIDLPNVLKVIPNGENYHWGVLPFFDPMGVHQKNASKISSKIRSQISENGFALVTWEEILVLAQGVCQFFDLVLIGCKDLKNLKPYQDDDEMVEKCDIVIMMFDTSWWEVSCKEDQLMQKFMDSFQKVRTIYWGEDPTVKE